MAYSLRLSEGGIDNRRIEVEPSERRLTLLSTKDLLLDHIREKYERNLSSCPELFS
jgi:hypothetical protein